MAAKGLRPRPSHALYSIRWKLSSNTYPTGSKRHKYLERFFTLDLRCLDDRSTKRWFIGDSHGDAKRPLSSKFIAARDCYRRAGTINNIYTYRYHSLFRSCSFCCSRTGFTGKKKATAAFKRDSTVWFFIQFTDACTPIYLGTRPAGHRLILLATGNKLQFHVDLWLTGLVSAPRTADD